MPQHSARRKRRPEGPADCFTVAEFCQRNRISERFYYKLKAEGKAPQEVRIGGRVLITREAADAWRAALPPAAK